MHASHGLKFKVPGYAWDDWKEISHFALDALGTFVNTEINEIRVSTVVNIVQAKVPATFYGLRTLRTASVGERNIEPVVRGHTVIVHLIILVYVGENRRPIIEVVAKKISEATSRQRKGITGSVDKHRRGF